MNKILKIVAIGAACFTLVTNLHHAIVNYGLSTNQISQPIFAQTGSSTGGSSSGGGGSNDDPVPTSCPEASITQLTQQKNDAKSCNCTVKRRVSVGGGGSTGWEFDYEYYTFRGIENTCKSGDQTCSAFACSSQQNGGGSSSGGDSGGGSSTGG